jgi:hypothetical protein
MYEQKKAFTVVLAVLLLCLTAIGAPKSSNVAPAKGEITGLLWRDPTDIASRNLFYGCGGQEHEPHPPFQFLKEDVEGTSPKFIVSDKDGVKWKVKLGGEARPETVASRLVWAAGYFTNENYYVADLQVNNMPARLHRGRELVAPDGSMRGARFKRDPEGEKKMANWAWRHTSFAGKREFNGLRVLMALINNWDLKDINTAVYDNENGERVYAVSDLGASFGAPGFSWSMQESRGNLEAYSRAKFIRNITSEFVDFVAPSRPALLRSPDLPAYMKRMRMRWIGRHIPRQDAKWMGELLARLSPAQIRDAFRAGGYSADEVEGFARVVEARIAQLNEL